MKNVEVYFIRCGKTGPIKIGSTNTLDVRIKSLQAANPQKLIIMGILSQEYYRKKKVKTYDADRRRLEYEIHEMFDEERMIHEWFSPSHRLLGFIRENTRKVTRKDLGLVLRKTRRSYAIKLHEYL